ncbi:MAG: hypothetical protein ABIE22_02370 [archaeon]
MADENYKKSYVQIHEDLMKKFGEDAQVYGDSNPFEGSDDDKSVAFTELNHEFFRFAYLSFKPQEALKVALGVPANKLFPEVASWMKDPDNPSQLEMACLEEIVPALVDSVYITGAGFEVKGTFTGYATLGKELFDLPYEFTFSVYGREDPFEEFLKLYEGVEEFCKTTRKMERSVPGLFKQMCGLKEAGGENESL